MDYPHRPPHLRQQMEAQQKRRLQHMQLGDRGGGGGGVGEGEGDDFLSHLQHLPEVLLPEQLVSNATLIVVPITLLSQVTTFNNID